MLVAVFYNRLNLFIIQLPGHIHCRSTPRSTLSIATRATTLYSHRLEQGYQSIQSFTYGIHIHRHDLDRITKLIASLSLPCAVRLLLYVLSVFPFNSLRVRGIDRLKMDQLPPAQPLSTARPKHAKEYVCFDSVLLSKRDFQIKLKQPLLCSAETTAAIEQKGNGTNKQDTTINIYRNVSESDN